MPVRQETSHLESSLNLFYSGVECRDEVYSDIQSNLVTQECETTNLTSCSPCLNNNSTVPEIVVEEVETSSLLRDTTIGSVHAPSPLHKQLISPPIISPPVKSPPSQPRPLAATEKIFAPRTEEMNKGFLTFSEEESGLTMLKDEPDDLTHLAPVAGDLCVPLDDHPFLTDMLLDDFLLKENFGPLLTDEPSDPFISYRDSYNPSPQLLSPNVSKSSDCSLPSLNSPGGSLGSLGDDDQMSAFINLNVDEESDANIKTNYMQMNLDNDILMSSDLMWGSTERNNMKNIPENGSSLAQLLSSSVSKHSMKSTEGGGGLSNRVTNNDLYINKGSPKWKSIGTSQQLSDRLECKTNISSKRPNSSTFSESPPKRMRLEPRDKMSPELLHQLISNNQHRQSPKGKSNWLFDSGGQKAACISQPSDSVLMNLLVNNSDKVDIDEPMPGEDSYPYITVKLMVDRNDLEKIRTAQKNQKLTRKRSISLLNPEATTISFLQDLTQRDFDVNAPVTSNLLQGCELLNALDVNTAI